MPQIAVVSCVHNPTASRARRFHEQKWLDKSMVECLPSTKRGSIVYHGRTGSATRQPVAGHAGHADPPDASPRTCSRPPDRKAYSTDHERVSANAAWLALSRAPPAGAEGLGHLEMGHGPKLQAGIQVLPFD